MATIKCMNCDADVKKGAKFCEVCGTKTELPIAEAVEPPIAEAVESPEMQNENSTEIVRTSETQIKKLIKMKPLIIACSAVCVVIIGVIVLLSSNVFNDPTRDIISALENNDFDEAITVFRNSDIDSEELEWELENRLFAIRTQFINGEIEYNTAKMEIQTIERFRIQRLSGQIAELLQFLDELNNSHIAFSVAEVLFESGDYVGAIEQYNKVMLDDMNYDSARTGILRATAEYKSIALTEAASLADDENYSQAISLLNNALSVVGNDVEIQTEITRYETLMLARDREIVLGQIEEINSSALSSRNFDDGITELKNLLTQNPHLNTELNPAITKMTEDLLRTAVFNLNMTSVRIALNESETLSFTSSPANIRNIQTLWSSTDNSVATVNDNGRITAQGVGTTEINLTTSDGIILATCEVIVFRPPTPISELFFDSSATNVSWGSSNVDLWDDVIMGGNNYINVIAFDATGGWGFGGSGPQTVTKNALINLNGRYNWFNASIGRVDGTDGLIDASINIYADDVLIESFEQSAAALPRELRLSVEDVRLIRVEVITVVRDSRNITYALYGSVSVD
jgi:tetratricopeptide (TPR) repeat protein